MLDEQKNRICRGSSFIVGSVVYSMQAHSSPAHASRHCGGYVEAYSYTHTHGDGDDDPCGIGICGRFSVGFSQNKFLACGNINQIT